jgi:hypothetical protein
MSTYVAEITTPIKNAPKLGNVCQATKYTGGLEIYARIIESTHCRDERDFTNADKGTDGKYLA